MPHQKGRCFDSGLPSLPWDEISHIIDVPVNTRYSIRMLCTLAQADRSDNPAALAERIGTSRRALEDVHAILKRHGISEGSIGTRSGLVVKRALSDIRLGELLLLFDDAVDLSMCRTGLSASCPEGRQCPSRVNWRAVK